MRLGPGESRAAVCPRSGALRCARQDLDIDPPTRPKALASLIIALCDSLMLQWLVDPDAAPSAAEEVKAGARLRAASAVRGPQPRLSTRLGTLKCRACAEQWGFVSERFSVPDSVDPLRPPAQEAGDERASNLDALTRIQDEEPMSPTRLGGRPQCRGSGRCARWRLAYPAVRCRGERGQGRRELCLDELASPDPHEERAAPERLGIELP